MNENILSNILKAVLIAYYALICITVFIAFSKEKNILIAMIGSFVGGGTIFAVSILPIFLTWLIPEEYYIVRHSITFLYLSIISFFIYKYFLSNYLKKEYVNQSNSNYKNTGSINNEEDLTKKKNVISNNEKHKLKSPTDSYSLNEQPKAVVTENLADFHFAEKTFQDIKPIIKKKATEQLPAPNIEPKIEFTSNNFVKYSSNIEDIVSNYPVIKTPKFNCIVRTHRTGASKRRGFKEDTFQKTITNYFSPKFQVSGDIRLNTGKSTRPFEPDIALICSSDKNIRIDIEIDEPYAGLSRQPTHCKGEDINRDNYFTDRGWIVIRFSEYQVHTKEKECLKFIANIIRSIDNSYQIPKDLEISHSINNENFWDIVQAQKWEKAKYREEYLGHEFQETDEQVETLNRDFNEQEIEEEKLVNPTSIGIATNDNNTGFNKTNSHERDDRIKFYSEKHIYTIDGVPALSASTIISRFFPEFDTIKWANKKAPELGMHPKEVADMWESNGNKARDKGTFLHKQIENYFLGNDYAETEEFSQFLDFVSKHKSIIPYRSEWRIFNEKYNIAGTIDFIVANDGGYDIYDWKRSKKVVNAINGSPIVNNQWQQGVGMLSNIDDTSYNRYSLQQSLYKYILEANYGIKISNMYLVVMYPDYENYYKVKVPYLKTEIEHILRTV